MIVITCEPGKIWTPRKILALAVKRAKSSCEHVLVVMDSIVMNVDSKSNEKQLLIDYSDKLNLRYYTKHMKKVRIK